MSHNQALEQAAKLISIVQSKRQVDCEVYVTERTNLSIKVYQQQVETLTEARSLGLGLRVVDNGRLGFVYTSDFSETNFQAIAKKALELSEVSTSDQHNILPSSQGQLPELSIYDPNIKATPISEKINMVMIMEETAKGYDPVIKTVEASFYQDECREITIVNSNGLKGSYQGSHCLLYVSPLAMKDGEAQSSSEYELSRNLNELDPRKIALLAAEKSKKLLGGKTIKTCSLPVIYSAKVASEFLAEIAGAVNANAVLKGRSLFTDKLGSRIAATEVTIVDNGLMEKGISTAPFDDEGVISQNTEVISEGVLSNYLHNTYTASRMGQLSTGNASRSGYRSLPSIGATNFALKPGTKTEDEIIGSISQGLYIERIMNVGGINPVSGDYSVGATGFFIENGQLTYPVQKITVASNVLTMLQNIVAIADNPKFVPTHRGVCGAPAILFQEMTIGGL